MPKPGGFSRRDVLKGVTAAGIAVGGGTLLAGCGGAEAETDSSTTERIVRGGSLTVAMITAGRAETLSVMTGYTVPDILRVQQIFEPLFNFTEKGPEPWLAESAESDPRGRRWTFRLRQGVRWHDGRPLTADDVVWTMRNWLEPTSFESAVMSPLLDAGAIRKRDARTVEVTLKRPVADFPSLTAFYNAFVIQDGTKPEGFTAPVGTGPFAFVSFTPGTRSVFKANRDYWRAREPYVDELIVDSSFTDDNARLLAVQSGTADVAPILPYPLAKSSADGLRISSARGTQIQAFGMAVDRGPLRDVRVRQALRLLADRPAIVKSAFVGFAEPGNDLVGPGLRYYAADLQREHDVEQARSLLRQAGQQDLRVSLVTGPVVSGAVESAVLYKSQAQAGGVTVQVSKIEAGQVFDTTAGYLERPFFFTSSGAGAATPSLTSYYLSNIWTGAPYPETHFGDAATDALLFDAVGETDPAKAQDKWHEVQRVQFDEGGYLVYANCDFVDGYARSVGGLEATPAGWAAGFAFRRAWKAA